MCLINKTLPENKSNFADHELIMADFLNNKVMQFSWFYIITNGTPKYLCLSFGPKILQPDELIQFGKGFVLKGIITDFSMFSLDLEAKV